MRNKKIKQFKDKKIIQIIFMVFWFLQLFDFEFKNWISEIISIIVKILNEHK